MTLFIGYPVYPISLSAQPYDCRSYELVQIYYATINAQVFENLHQKDIEITFRDLIKFPNNYVVDVINNWFKKIETIGPISDLFFLTIYNSSMKPHLCFLTLMDAVETFHRRVCGERHINSGKYINPEDYQLVQKTLFNAIPNGLNPDLKENLKSKISSSNLFSLKMRLKDLRNYKRGGFNWFKMIMESETKDEEEFIGKLVFTRNYYTHCNEKNKERIFNDRDLPRINYELKQLLRILLIAEVDSKGILSEFKIFQSYRDEMR